MEACYILKSLDYDSLRGISSLLRFKYQNIFLPNLTSVKHQGDNIVGAELLVDFDYLEAIGIARHQSYRMICMGEASHKSLDYVAAITGKRVVFVNIERSNLCEIKILKRITILNTRLNLLGVELVVEVTERDFCGQCCRVIDGLTYLKNNDVKLACDDFDYTSFRLNQFNSELTLYYDYVKLEFPDNRNEIQDFNKFIKHFSDSKKIIIERIETIEQLRELPLDKLWGVQGFLFCKGVKLPRNPSFI